ncbi:SDR family NAD(P)-dependent oxidoreductase [Flavobacterium luminosum]|uniref:SDR family oxidoreductase n=1 Tax=Flavobacterium luminosum TaxID=2949086 RepID=A0ABT0TPG0_9FLAO|nr:SDR family oxidoreductase [Flavobacterium sp. HXWNR70]MCL9809375.1 SDR family oxidoreductase [Flavobacterium sp. HXWNR70]
MKKYLIIGGSKGISKEIVKQISAQGDFCYVISRTTPDYTFNGTHFTLNALTDDLPTIESLDGLVYGIGTINLKPFNRLSANDFLNDWQVNVMGAVKIIQHYLPQLKNSEQASIVLFSSVAAQRGMSFHASIGAAKGAVEGLVKSLAAELAPKIRVNAIAPSIVETPLAAGILRNETIKENMVAKHPLKRILQPEDVAKTAVFLLSDTSNGITGQIFIQDNGLISISN